MTLPARNITECTKVLCILLYISLILLIIVLQAKNRDKSRCVVTGQDLPHVCYVVPFSAKGNVDNNKQMLVCLTGFISAHRLQQLKKLIGANRTEIIDTCANMITLQSYLHDCWSRAMVAFEPVEKTTNCVTLRLWWLQCTSLKRYAEMRMDTHPDSAPRPLSEEEDGPLSGTFNLTTGRRVISGDIIEIHSDDPDNLPNWDLFLYQWDLLRMCALSGAAEWEDDDEDEEDDDDDDRLVV